MGGRRRAPWVLVCLVLLLPACSRSTIEQPSAAEANLGQRLNEHHEQLKRDGFRGVVDIRRNGERLLSEAYGMADVAGSRKNTVDTRFRVGGVTEQVTAFVVLALQAKKRLALTDPVCRHLPTCVPAWQPITVEQLLLHTSGLPDYLALGPEESAALDSQGLSHLQLVEYLQRKPLEQVPGKWKRSAANYVVLGALIEKLTSKPYGEYVKTTVLDPLGMTATSTEWDRSDPAGRAVGHTGPNGVAAPAPARYADRALTTTAADLNRWNAFLITGKPLFGEVEARLRLTNASNGPFTGVATQGYGAVFLNASPREEVVATGVVPGFEAFSAIREQLGVSVVVLSNTDDAEAAELGARLLATATLS
ncbi:serine hydrolase domain-containing protein [Actinosynnema sp. NPDC047251]|uniref:Beta-lactamase-related domain-containing protein n=1 Tax=Saccharothrix espanaensis (strain ATCC 51144 / DSM 44229 / JCM 9112 / NBRC 15066 / NRRL 15764) TaxID=1179773 RepID=K0K6V1_SACES|nr:serine hydrolase domain-containing protein [Saccharothrix espanaensis]CCH34056.1 hypothetical protein BN6_68190 [Saccharothrix espanaensis DSM 44229]